MAGSVKKGFGTYLFIFIMALVAAFLITIVVMIFQPFQNVLGFTYFTYDEEKLIYELTDDNKTSIALDSRETINIDCDYAEVRVERSTKVDEPAVRVTNKSKGFAKFEDFTEFSYQVTKANYENILNITINEPQGFVFFQKDVEVAILLPAFEAVATENVELNITTTGGNVYLGSQNKITEQRKDKTTYPNISFKNMFVSCGDGDLIVFPQVENSVENVYLRTKGGNITVYPSFTDASNITFRTETGRISINEVKSDNINLNVGNGQFNGSKLTGEVSLLAQNGYIKVNLIQGNLTSFDSASQFEKANISLAEINGNVSFPFANGSKIYIGKTNETSQVAISGTNGSVTIDNLYGAGWIKLTSGNIKINTYATDISAETTTGNINVTYNANAILNQLDFVSTSGQINVNANDVLAFKIEAYKTNRENKTDNVNVETFDGFSNPVVINGGSKLMKFVSDGKINVNFFTVVEN